MAAGFNFFFVALGGQEPRTCPELADDLIGYWKFDNNPTDSSSTQKHFSPC